MTKPCKTELRIGVSCIDITPPVGVTLSGYKPRIATGVGHRLRAEALYCRSVNDAWVLITSDVIGYPQSFVKAVRAKITRETGLPPESILISGSHTHSGPAVLWFGDGEAGALDREYEAGLQDKLVELTEEAKKAAAPGCFEAGWSEAPLLGSNRRICRDGKWINEWEDEAGLHTGYFDPTVMLLGVCRPDQSEREALLINYGVHPVVLGPASLDISADYAGYLKDSIEASGSTKTAMFALAGSGNINPRVCIRTGAEHPQRMGEALAEIVCEAAEKLSPVAGDRVTSHSQPWNFTRTRFVPKMPEQYSTVSTEIQILRAGELAVIGIPGELFSEFNRILRAASPFPYTVIVSMANDYIGYLPTDAAQAEGAYEPTMAPADNIEGMIMEHARQAFDAVAD
jgi:hypothetical protein